MTKITFITPLIPSLSKNRMFRYTRSGNRYMPKDTKDAMNYVCGIISQSSNGHKWDKTKKVWVSGMVNRGWTIVHCKNGKTQKRQSKIDAINFIDTYCDCIKNVIGIDDIQFAIGIWDYTDHNINESIVIDVWQED